MNKETNKKESFNPELLDKIMVIQKYQNSERFGKYVKNEIGIRYSEKQMKKMSTDKLDEVLYIIRTRLDNKNTDKIFDNMATSVATAIELTVSPFYDIDGYKDELLANEQFWDTFERFKIEHKLPIIPPSVQLLYLMSSTALNIFNFKTSKYSVILISKCLFIQ